MHFTPTSISQYDRRYVEKHNQNPKPFIWTAKARDILAKVTRSRTRLNETQFV
jgi:hypothetical protein